MKKNNTSEEILDFLKKYERVIIPLHQAPDGDCIGSSLALKYFLEKELSKKVFVISDDEISETFKKIEFCSEIDFDFKDFKNEDEKTLFIFSDHGFLPKKWFGLDFDFTVFDILNIDHHATNTYFGNLNFVDSKASSACSVLLELFKKWNVNFDTDLSNRILMGIFTDTGGFMRGKKDLEDALFLVNSGANYPGVIEILKNNIPLNIARYHSKLVDNFKIIKIKNYNVGYSSLSKQEIEKFDLNTSEIRSAPNHILKIMGTDMVFTLAETEKFIKGSFRTKKENIDVSLLAEKLGGGGHKKAAGFYLFDINLKEAEDKVLKILNKFENTENKKVFGAD